MRRLIHVVPALGIVLVVLSQVPQVAAKLPGRPQAWLASGLALVLLYVLARWEDIAKVVGRRQLRYGTNTAVLTVVVLAILGTSNWLLSRRTLRWDLTKSQKYTLSEQTRKVVTSLKEDVKITHFFLDDERAARGTVEIDERLKEFKALSPKIKIAQSNARKEPAQARKYDIKAVPTLVFEYGEKRETTNSGSEQDLTNTLIKVTRAGKKTICFLKGEGERDPSDTTERGYSAAKAALEKSQYGTLDVFLVRESRVPEACTAVMVAGPEKDLLPESVTALKAFVAGGGRALVMVEPEFKTPLPNLGGLLKEWNIEVGNDVVLEVYSRFSPTQGIVSFAAETVDVEQYPYHEITRGFPFPTRFDTTRSVKAGTASPGSGTAQNFIETSKSSWAEHDLTLKEPIQLDEGKDTRGPVSIAAVATIAAVSAATPSPAPSPSASPLEEEPKKVEGRVAVFGDSDFASNALLGFQGNENFFLNVMAWLSGDTDLISIRARDPEDHRLSIIPGSVTHRLTLLAGLLALPGLFVVLGIANWWRRR